MPVALALLGLLAGGCASGAYADVLVVRSDSSSVPPTYLLEGGDDATTTTTRPPRTSPEAEAYLATALDFLETHALAADHIEWDTLRTEASADADGAQEPADTYPAIRRALKVLGDDGSMFLDPLQVQALYGETWGLLVPPMGRVVEAAEPIAYVKVYGFTGPRSAGRYSQELQWMVSGLDSQGVCGWIIDLRDAGGWDAYPVLAGLSPLFDDPAAVTFVYPNGRQGRPDPDQLFLPTQYTLADPARPIAVLIGGDTSGAGEWVALTFRGMANARLFGASTAGQTTVPASLRLSDGALLFVSEAAIRDRLGWQGGLNRPVVPDDPRPVSEAMAGAMEWLLETCPG